MSGNTYELVFYGELVHDADLAETKQRLGELFKASDEQIARMFSGNRVVIRNKLDKETAEKYQTAIHKRGAKCLVESRIPEAAPKPTQPAPSATPKVNVADNYAGDASDNYSNIPTAEVEETDDVDPRIFEKPTRNEQATHTEPEEPAAQPATALEASLPESSPDFSPSTPREPGIHLAGDNVDNILATSNLNIAPVGADLADKQPEAAAPNLSMQDSLSIAPVGSDLADKKQGPEPIAPDTSHLSVSK